MGAIGAALMSMAKRERWEDPTKGFAPLEAYLSSKPGDTGSYAPLTVLPGTYIQCSLSGAEAEDPNRIEAYLGVDVGSISTNVVVIDREGRVLSKQYLMTAGRPLEAVREGLRLAGEETGRRVRIMGAATTGSGRYLTGDFIGADIVRNEITAQATAAAAIDPAVDTIFEIGGQDSKFISLEDGAIVDFMMNKVCAAGTGSFLEEQAEKLGISIKEEFGNLAVSAKRPVKLGERCTVFMESDLIHHQQKGAQKPDLVAGLSYSIVLNYLNKVVEHRRIGQKIFYQGATAANQGIVAAFEEVLKKQIYVPEHHEVTGAIGVALLAMRERTWQESRFKGFDLSRIPYEVSTFECDGCPNQCEIKKVTLAGEKPHFYGSRCEKYDQDRKGKKGAHLPDLFLEREELLTSFIQNPDPSRSRGRVGLPRTMVFRELLPFFSVFLNTLGLGVAVTRVTNKKIIHRGVECMVAETCFPIKVAHGHLFEIQDQEEDLDYILLPSVITLKNEQEGFQEGCACPYAQALPYMVPSAMDLKSSKARWLMPVLHFGRGEKVLKEGLTRLAASLGVRNPFLVARAVKRGMEAQETFGRTMLDKGREALARLAPGEQAMVVISRPYNGLDPGLNLGIPRKLRDLGVLCLPMDALPLKEVREIEDVKDHYWRYGQKILTAGELIVRDKRLNAIYITNFGCGPDSFIQHFFRKVMEGKPYLEIEIDEHSADAGVVTRLEAFLDSLRNRKGEEKDHVSRKALRVSVKGNSRRIYIPPMTDHSYAVAAAFRACGAEAEVLPDSDEETLRLGRKYTTGKECYPCILTTGDMIKKILEPGFDPGHSAFFMPSATGPCRFGEYHRFHRQVLDELGYPQIPIFAPDQSDTFYEELGMVGGSDFTRLGWQGVVSVDCLEKKLRETRPYELNSGQTDQVYREALEKICAAIQNRGELTAALREAREVLDQIPVKDRGSRPVVGVVGEIYTRANRFANEEVVREIESLGGEVWLAPIAEWIYYTNHMSLLKSFRLRRYRYLLKLLLTNYYQNKDGQLLESIFKGSVRRHEEPPVRETLRRAAPYLDISFEGEAILSIGKSHEYIERGAAGIVNVIPFTCMPGTIVNAISKRFREEQDNIPFLNMAYDGQSQTNTRTRLEAFMYQVTQYHRVRH
jgi:predicted CoA-substrate-specific enzyme activase